MTLSVLRFSVLLSLLVYGTVDSCKAGTVSSLDDLEFWVGSGANRTALVLDWDGESMADESMAWGYRWNGTATGEDMLRDILAADSRLYSKISAGGPSGIAVYGLGYDLNNDGTFAISDGTNFDSDGIYVSSPADGAISNNASDLYTEGWFLGFWHLGTASTNPFGGGTWAAGSGGISSINLADNTWTSLAFTTDTLSNTAFAANPIAAEPEGSAADFDTDEDVDGADFLAWQQGFGILSGATHAQGDADANEKIDGNDLQFWSSDFGLMAAASATTFYSTTVPEPSSVCLLVGMFFVLISFRMRS